MLPFGRLSAWTCFGYVLASEQARMVAVHDCDILTYNRELLARLCYPVVHPSLGFDFCKGYYARVTDQLNGRVMRLMVTPLLRALKSILGQHPYLVYMDTSLNGLKYPRHEEENAVATFVRSIRIATKAFQEDPLWTPLISNWNRVESACPHFLDDLREAVRLDNE